jgi:hypothetical protein
VVAAGISAVRVTSRPDQFATTTPVMSATATERPSPIAVIFQGFHAVVVMSDLLD